MEFLNSAERNKYYLYAPTGEKLVELNWVPMGKDYSLDPAALEPVRHAERVIVTYGGLAVALAPDFVHHPEANFVLGRYENQNPTTQEQIIRILQENGIEFEVEPREKTNTLLPTPDAYLIGGEGPSPGGVRVSQPLMRLRVPLGELAAEARPRVEAQRAREEADKRKATTVGGIGAVALVGVLGASAIGVVRSRRNP